MTNEEKIDELAGAILAARDFCGNEAEALRETALELGIQNPKTSALVLAAREKAEKVWNRERRKAGVYARRNQKAFGL